MKLRVCSILLRAIWVSITRVRLISSSRLKATLGLRYDFMYTSIHYDTYAYMAMTAKVMGRGGYLYFAFNAQPQNG